MASPMVASPWGERPATSNMDRPERAATDRMSRTSATAGRPRLRLVLVDGEAPAVAAPVAAGNAMAPLLVLFAAIARGDGVALLPAGPGRVLRVELDHG